MTSKNSTHPRLEKIVKATGGVKLLRGDEEFTVIQIILDLATSEVDSQNHTSGDKTDKTDKTAVLPGRRHDEKIINS